MSLLNQVKKGKQVLPHLALFYGPDGVGKSTIGASAPNPIFFGPELGTMNLDVARFPSPQSWKDMFAACDSLLNENHDYKTLVLDSLDWIELLLHRDICMRDKVASMELACGGYGKAYSEAFNEMTKLRDKLTELRMKKNMNILLICHSRVSEFQDPTTDVGYSRYELKLQDGKNISNRAMWREYVDSVLFCNFETFSKGDGKQARGVSTRERKMWTERSAAYDAKNRFGLPSELPLNYEAYDLAVKERQAKPDQAPDVITRIQKLMTHNKDKELEPKVLEQVEKNKTNVEQLQKIETRLRTKIGDAHV